jgi:tetratricopeptide (TPR) repeat protein
MKLTNLIKIILFAISLSSCSNEKTKITDAKDYNKYLSISEDKNVLLAKKEIDFWQNKYDAAPNQTTYLSQLASHYTSLFDATFEVNHLYKAENLLIQVNENLNFSEVGPIRALAKNYITQHRFKEALVLANKALKIGEGFKETQKLLFDVNMELGNYTEAKKNLSKFYNTEDFDYLIRMAKWNDHIGDLPTAITLMEKATKKAELNEDKTLKIWSYSNLGDMYGHAGRIEDSYAFYLKTLKEDENNYYALKGIAWIAFSHEKNTKEANRIIDVIAQKHNSPDFKLFKAEMAEFDKNETEKTKNINDYFAALKSKNYGVMYNKYNATLFADNKKDAAKALEIAYQEIKNRPTPESYDLLAWANFNLGNTKKALEICEKHIVNKSFEPEINYHLAEIYKANKMEDKIEPIKEDLISSIYELGPNMKEKIEKL